MSSAARTFEEYIALAKKYEAEAEDENLPEEEEEELLRQAAQSYARASALQPNNPAALFDWGRIALTLARFPDEEEYDERLSHYKTAIEKLQAAYKIDPSNGPCLFNLAHAIASETDVRLEMEDEDEDVGEDQEQVYIEYKEKYEKALEMFEKVLSIQKNELSNGLPVENPVTTRDLIETISAQVDVLTSLAYIDTKGDFDSYFDKAEKILQEGLEMDSEEKAKLYFEWSNVVQSRIDRQVEVDPELKPDYTPAIEKLDMAIKMDPEYAPAYMEKAEILLGQANALMLDDALLNRPEDEEFSYKQTLMAPEVQQKFDQLQDEAFALMEKAVELDPEDDEYAQRAGDVAFGQSRASLDTDPTTSKQKMDKAERFYRQALKLDEENPAFILRIAQVEFFKEGKEKEVNRLLEKYKAMGGTLDDAVEEPETFEEEFLNKMSDLFPETAWEDQYDDDDEDDDDFIE